MATVRRRNELPVLVSTRDTRRRTDLVTADLFDTEVMRADRIVYHPGDTAAAHYHRDCSHFFLILAGRGILHAGSGDEPLEAGDVALVEADEVHSFSNPHDGDFEFIELWVPAPSDTVWVKEGDVCTWAPEDR